MGNGNARDRRKAIAGNKINKSGRFEIRSEFMKAAADKVMGDIKGFLRPDEGWVAEQLTAGLPSWVPVPEHRKRTRDQLIMTSFKVNVQIHSRSQNCKWLQEVYHNNPAWIIRRLATARRLQPRITLHANSVAHFPRRPFGKGDRHQLTQSRRTTAGRLPRRVRF